MEKSIYKIQLKDLTPSDVPRKDSWERARTLIPGKINQSSTILLSDFRIEVARTFFHGLVPVDGNNKIARFIQCLGENTTVAVALTSGIARLPEILLWPSYLDDRVEKIRTLGICSFSDFINACVNNQFARFLSYAEERNGIDIA